MNKPARKLPVSENRLAANRANARKSTGPRTTEGKARSAQNAVKHGFTGSAFAVVRFEDRDEISKLKADAVDFYQPRNSQEMFAVECIALAQADMRRLRRIEAGLFTTAFDSVVDRSGRPFTPMSADMCEGDLAVTIAQNRNYAMAEGFRRMVCESNVWALLIRYQAHAERQYRRAIEDFERIRAHRDDSPNEPISLTQPPETEQLATPDDLNLHIPELENPLYPSPHPPHAGGVPAKS